jgi:hypothetical protein
LMIWQDIVIGAMGFLFSLMMIPQVQDSREGRHVNSHTSLLTTLGLFVMGSTFATLELWLSTVSTYVNGIMWLLLFVLAARDQKKEKAEN